VDRSPGTGRFGQAREERRYASSATATGSVRTSNSSLRRPRRRSDSGGTRRCSRSATRGRATSSARIPETTPQMGSEP
jgi:hypothetical protein